MHKNGNILPYVSCYHFRVGFFWGTCYVIGVSNQRNQIEYSTIRCRLGPYVFYRSICFSRVMPLERITHDKPLTTSRQILVPVVNRRKKFIKRSNYLRLQIGLLKTKPLNSILRKGIIKNI